MNSLIFFLFLHREANIRPSDLRNPSLSKAIFSALANFKPSPSITPSTTPTQTTKPTQQTQEVIPEPTSDPIQDPIPEPIQEPTPDPTPDPIQEPELPSTDFLPPPPSDVIDLDEYIKSHPNTIPEQEENQQIIQEENQENHENQDLFLPPPPNLTLPTQSQNIPSDPFELSSLSLPPPPTSEITSIPSESQIPMKKGIPPPPPSGKVPPPPPSATAPVPKVPVGQKNMSSSLDFSNLSESLISKKSELKSVSDLPPIKDMTRQDRDSLVSILADALKDVKNLPQENECVENDNDDEWSD